MDRKKTIKNIFFYGIVATLSILVIVSLVWIIGFVLVKGLPNINLEFLTKEPSKMGKEGGILSVIVGTIYITFVSIIIATPIGIGGAVYFTEYAKDGFVVRTIRFFNNILAGIPSIIFGLFGFAFFVIFCGFGWSVLSGGITLALMILPTIVRATEESLKTVAESYREASLALGATKWETTWKIIIPACKSGILSGLILGIGRAIGETAALILTAGGALNMPVSIFDSTRTMSIHLYTLASEGLSEEKTFATAALLILIVLGINIIANKVILGIGKIK